MNTLLNKSIVGTLALTLVIAVGSDAAYAQKSFRGALKGRFSSNNGGGGGNNNSFNFQNNNNSQGNSNQGLTQQNTNRGLFSGNNFSGNNFGTNNSGNKSKGFRGLGSGNLQNLLQNQNNGTQGIRSQDLQNNNGLNKLRNGGLQNLLGNSNNNRTLNTIPGLNNLGKTDNNTNGDSKLKNWLNNQNGNGNNSKGGKWLNQILHNQQQGNLYVKHDHWCHTKPKHCHWWYNWCKPIAYCAPHHQVHCHWNYVTCDYIVGGHVVVADARWYLGMKGLLLPGQGVGIEEVAPGSPAAAVGLQPGMVITRCNGFDLVDETVLGQVIAQSGGVLQMDLRLSADGPPATCVVVMQRVASVNF